MNRILLVARRDFLQIVSTRAFTRSRAADRAAHGAGAAKHLIFAPGPRQFGYVRRPMRVRQRRAGDRSVGSNLITSVGVLRDLSAYAARWKLPQPGEDQGNYQADDAAVERFIAPGVGAAKRALRRMHPPGRCHCLQASAAGPICVCRSREGRVLVVDMRCRGFRSRHRSL